MRVVAGTARSVSLVTPSGPHTRPTTDRIKETLFNIIQGDVPGCRFLDLFAGSGGVGIEALSRGAESAVFVDSDSQAIRCVKANLAHTHLDKNADVLAMDAGRALYKLAAAGKRFDVIFVDPPYESDYESILQSISRSGVLDPEGIVIAEMDADRELSLEGTGLRIYREKDYKNNKHVFICMEREDQDEAR